MMLRKLTFFFILMGLLGFFMSPQALAQTTMGTLRGVVIDSSKGALPGVTVTVTNLNTGAARTVWTDEAGRYTVLSLPAAPYTIRAELAGFTPTVRERVTLEVAHTLDLDFVLEVAGIKEKVTVTAEAPLTNRDTAELGGGLDPRRLIELPNNGRDFTRFSLLVPGAATVRGSVIANVTFNGLHSTHNSYTMDGVDASGVEAPQIAAGYQRGARLLTGSLDSIQEFRVHTGNYQAEYGRAAGGVVNIVTKSGGNTVHGTLFEFLRNSALDARNFFSPPGQGKPLYILNQFGGNLSGPIVKNKTFYFVNYEGSRQHIGVTGSGTVPSQPLRQRILATSPALAPLVATIPLGTSPTSNPDVDNYTTVRTLSVREDTGSIKVDHRLSERDSFFARFNLNDTRVLGPHYAVIPESLATDQIQTIPARTINFTVQEQHTFFANMVNELKAGVQRNVGQTSVDSPLPRTTITGLRLALGSPRRLTDRATSYQVIDHLSISRGPHVWKAGLEVRRLRVNNRRAELINLRYTALEDFVRNRVFRADLTSANPGRGVRQTQYGFYFQDDFKARRNLTLNLGLRYEYYTVLSEVRDRVQILNPLTGNLDPPGAPWYRPDRNNVAPRFGFAWSPWFSDKTIVRGGFGLYHQPPPIFLLTMTANIYANSLPGSTTLLRDQIPNLSFPVEPFIGSGNTPIPSMHGFDPQRRDIYTEQWNLSLQQELGSNMIWQMAYVGNHGLNLYRTRNINLVDPRLRRRPNPRFADITVHENTAQSVYHAMQVSLRRRSSSGLAFDLAYTYGHAIADVYDLQSGGVIPVPQDSNNLKAERGNSSIDIRQILAFNAVYELPFGHGRSFLSNTSGVWGRLLSGWQMNGVCLLRAGRPYSVELGGASPSMDGNTVNQRPDRVARTPSQPANRSINQWLDRAAFVEPRPGTYGNLGPNTERGPGFVQIDGSLLKTTKLSETKSLQFRAEFFNIFNHPNFDVPLAQFRDGTTFGRVFDTYGRTIGLGTPRQIQFGLKYLF